MTYSPYNKDLLIQKHRDLWIEFSVFSVFFTLFTITLIFAPMNFVFRSFTAFATGVLFASSCHTLQDIIQTRRQIRRTF